MIKAGIIGATGYAGNELARLLLGHKDVEVAWYGSRSYIDQKYADVYQNFFKLVDAKCIPYHLRWLYFALHVSGFANIWQTPRGILLNLIDYTSILHNMQYIILTDFAPVFLWFVNSRVLFPILWCIFMQNIF